VALCTEGWDRPAASQCAANLERNPTAKNSLTSSPIGLVLNPSPSLDGNWAFKKCDKCVCVSVDYRRDDRNKFPSIPASLIQQIIPGGLSGLIG
jgi:hypothetical protein